MTHNGSPLNWANRRHTPFFLPSWKRMSSIRAAQQQRLVDGESCQYTPSRENCLSSTVVSADFCAPLPIPPGQLTHSPRSLWQWLRKQSLQHIVLPNNPPYPHPRPANSPRSLWQRVRLVESTVSTSLLTVVSTQTVHSSSLLLSNFWSTSVHDRESRGPLYSSTVTGNSDTLHGERGNWGGRERWCTVVHSFVQLLAVWRKGSQLIFNTLTIVFNMQLWRTLSFCSAM